MLRFFCQNRKKWRKLGKSETWHLKTLTLMESNPEKNAPLLELKNS